MAPPNSSTNAGWITRVSHGERHSGGGGKSLEENQGEAFRIRIIHPDDVESVRGERRQALARGTPFELEQRMLRNDGQYRWFIIRYKPLRDDQGRILHWYATGTDIDDHKQAEDRMRNENKALREEIDHASMFEEIVWSSEALRRVLRQVAKVAPVDATVLLLEKPAPGKN